MFVQDAVHFLIRNDRTWPVCVPIGSGAHDSWLHSLPHPPVSGRGTTHCGLSAI